MESLKNRIESFILIQRDIASKINNLDKNATSLEEDVKKYIFLAWDELHSNMSSKNVTQSDLFIPSFQGGLYATDYQAELEISVNGYDILDDKWFKILYDGGMKHYIRSDYCIDVSSFLAFSERMSDELGIKVTIHRNSKRIETRRISTFKELNSFFNNNLDLKYQGKVRYKEWDISDPFVICVEKTNQQLVIAYSNNGHGMGFDKILENPNKIEIDIFLSHVEQDNNTNVRDIINSLTVLK